MADGIVDSLPGADDATVAADPGPVEASAA